MKKTTIIAVRHGETVWNKQGRQQGHLDSELTDLGLRQARAMGEGLRAYAINHCYSSDLGRAVQTAGIVTGVLGLSYQKDSRLRERHLGILQGLTIREFQERYPEEFGRFRSFDPDYVLPGGESARQRQERAVACVQDLAARHEGSTLLVVSHGGILAGLMHAALGLPPAGRRRFSLYNGAINIFSITGDNDLHLEVWGELGHLRIAGLTALDDS